MLSGEGTGVEAARTPAASAGASGAQLGQRQDGAGAVLLSSAEKDFMRPALAAGVRPDGRSFLDERGLSVQLGVVPNADGSAVLQRGKTRVVVGVKAEFASATSAEARRRFFDGTVTCSSTASPMLEGRAGEAVSAELTGALNRMLCDRLGVQPPGAAPSGAPPAADAAPQWVLCADSVVLEADGALLDAASLALRAALADTRVPEVGAGAAAPGGGAPRLELLDAPLVPLPGAGDVPVFVTLAQVGPHVVADPLAAEEVCAAARLSVGVSADGRVAATHKAEGRALNPAHVSQMLRTARQMGVARIRQLHDICAGQDGGAARPDAIDHPLFS